jgi:hypothetical protein
MITLNQLEEMFTNMRDKTKWNVDGPLLWGYFFTHSDPEPLGRAAKSLANLGYRVAGIYKTDDGRHYVLHVERTERHTPKTLHLRNGEFERLAKETGLESYDGMDVGMAPLSDLGRNRGNKMGTEPDSIQ